MYNEGKGGSRYEKDEEWNFKNHSSLESHTKSAVHVDALVDLSFDINNCTSWWLRGDCRNNLFAVYFSEKNGQALEIKGMIRGCCKSR